MTETMEQFTLEALKSLTILDALYVLMENGALYLFLNLFLHKKPLRRYRQLLALFALLMIGWQFLAYFLFPSVPVKAIFIIAACMAIAWVLFSDKWYKTALFVLLFKMISLVLEVCVCALLVYAINDNALVLIRDVNMSVYICSFTTRLIEFAIVFLLRAMKNKTPHQRQWYGLLFVPVLSLAFIFIVYINYWGYNDSRINSLLFGLALFLVVQNLFVFVYIALVQGSTERYLEMEKAYERQKQYYNASRAVRKTVAVMAHDIRHHFVYLMNALESDDVPKAKKYLITLDENLKSFTPTKITGNDDVDALLYAKARPAIQQRIQISVDGKLPPDLNIPPTDISIVLGNALDNAIEACFKIEGNREITILFGFHDNRFSFIISNPYAGKIKRKLNGFLYSQKEGGGLGIGIMDQVIRRNDGYWLTDIDGQKYTLKIMMQTTRSHAIGLLEEETTA